MLAQIRLGLFFPTTNCTTAKNPRAISPDKRRGEGLIGDPTGQIAEVVAPIGGEGEGRGDNRAFLVLHQGHLCEGRP